jgi:membrane-bound lytic murein transglycosylase D
MAFDEIALKGATDLHALAGLADCSYQELCDLNPALLHGAAAAHDGITTLRVPEGKGEVLLKKLKGGAPLPAVNLTLKHRVRHGETLAGIASQYSVDAGQLARDNGIGRRRPLRRGMMLTVHGSISPSRPALANLDAADPRAHTSYVPPRTLGSRRVIDASSTADGRTMVTVQRGENLQMIADRYEVEVADLMRWNHLKSAHVSRGQRLRVRTSDEAQAEVSPEVKEKIAALHVYTPHRARHGHGHGRRQFASAHRRHASHGATASRIAKTPRAHRG